MVGGRVASDQTSADFKCPDDGAARGAVGTLSRQSRSATARAAGREASVLLVWMTAVFDPLLLKSPVFSGVRSPRAKMELSEGGAMDCDDMMRPLTDDELSAQPAPIARSSAQWDASASARFVQAEVVDRRENYGSVCLLRSMSLPLALSLSRARSCCSLLLATPLSAVV